MKVNASFPRTLETQRWNKRLAEGTIVLVAAWAATPVGLAQSELDN